MMMTFMYRIFSETRMKSDLKNNTSKTQRVAVYEKQPTG